MGRHLVFVLAIFCLQMSIAISWNVLVTSQEEFKGQQITVQGFEDECIDLPTEFTPMSLNTNNFCVKVYEGLRCTGRWLSFFPGLHNHERLSQFNLGKIVALKSCQTSF